MTASEPHAAFPSLAPQSGTYGSGSRSGSSKNLIPVPTTSEIATLIGQSTSLPSIRNHLIRALERVAESEDQSALLQTEQNLDELGDADLGGLSAALVYILTARLNKANEAGKPDLGLLNLCTRFASNFDVDQLRLCLKRVALLSWAMLRHSQICKKVDQVLGHLYNLATRPTPRGCMSGSQAAFLEACLLTRMYQGVSSITQDTFIDFKTAECTYLDVITFYHHAGLISAAHHDYNGAKELFVIAVSVPAQSPSAIQVAAAKRAILCELLSTGKQIRFPSSTSSSVVRAIERNASEYTNLAKSFGDARWEAVDRQATEGKRIWDQDCNAGLVHQVLTSVVKRKILKAKGVFSRLTVDQLLAKVAGDQPMSPSGIIDVLIGMRSTGEIKVTISDTNPQIITFPDDTTARGDEALAQLSQSRKLASFLESHLVGTGKQLGLDPKYLKKQAGILDLASSKPSGGRGNGNVNEVDMMMAAEELGGVGGPVRGAGSNLADMGF